MNFDLATNTLTKNVYISAVSDVREFTKKILASTEALESKGFTVVINTNTTNDEIWDGPISSISLFATKVLSQSEVDTWLTKVKENLKQAQKEEIAKYCTQFSAEVVAKTKENFEHRISKLMKDYEHVLYLKNDLEDPAVINALKGLNRAKKEFKEYQERVKAEIESPTSDKEIIKKSYYLTLEHFVTRTDQLQLLGY